MKQIYCIEIYQYDYCNSWTDDVLHTTNKKFLEDLCVKWNKQYARKDTLSFSIKCVSVLTTPSTRDVDKVKSFYNFIFQ